MSFIIKRRWLCWFTFYILLHTPVTSFPIICSVVHQRQRQQRTATTTRSRPSLVTRLKLSTDNDDNHNSVSSTRRTTTTSITPQSFQGLSNCASATQARRILTNALLLQRKHKDNDASISSFYESIFIPAGASSKPISDGDLAIQVRMLNSKYKITDLIEVSGDRDMDRASLAVVSLTIASFSSAVLVNQQLPGPEIIRFIVVWLLSFAPLAFVGYGIAKIDQLQATLIYIQRNLFPAYRSRMIQHEAGHFLMGHLLGYPVKTYSVNAVKNAVEFYPLADTDRGSDMASRLGFDQRRQSNSESSLTEQDKATDVPFFSDQGRGASILLERSVFRDIDQNSTRFQVDPENDPSQAWPFRPLDEDTLDRLTVISVAGVCAEILAFGQAEGGVADISQLRQLFAQAQLSERQVETRIRFALGFTMSQLRRHLGCLDTLSEVMERNGSVEECVYAIETCKNVVGGNPQLAVTMGAKYDYERLRRQEFRSKQINFVERILLGSEKTIDVEENRLVEGKGGGYRKETFRLTGDDPLYGAVAVAVCFLLWASNGGLSLH